MEITNIESFLDYYKKIKKRTERLFKYIPADKLEWTYREGRFTLGDLIRHLALTERYMYAETIQNLPSSYKGCDVSYADGLEEVITLYQEKQAETFTIFSKLTNEDLYKKCKTPADIPITTWKWLRAMVEHEVHHRGQIYTHLNK